MVSWLKSVFGGDGSSSPTEAIRRFSTKDATINQDRVAVDGDSWVVEVDEAQVVRLFEIFPPEVGRCLLTYRAALKSEGLEGQAFLEMWCRFPGYGEFFSKSLRQAVRGTSGWASYETPFRLKKNQRPDLIKLNLAVEGRGKVWIRDVELLKTPK